MKKILKYNLIALLAMVFSMYSCNDDDYTGYSKLNPTNPTITVSGIAGGGYSLNESAETIYTFDVTLSEAQVSDVALYVTQIDGDATVGEDYAIVNANSRVYIPANTTTAQLQIQIISDEVYEPSETLTLQIGDERTANGNITPVTVTFTLTNYTEDDLGIEMSWNTEVYDQYGDLIDPTDVADMMLLIYDDAGNLVDDADGGSFESLVLSNTEADGTYYIQADFYAAMAFDEPVDIELILDLNQIGVQTASFTSSVITTESINLCDYQVFLAKVVKAGTTYTISEIGTFEFDFADTDFIGNYGGDDGNDDFYAANVDIALDGSDLTIDGLATEWMVDYWGETITNKVPVTIVFNTDGTLAIEEQYYMTTLWGGDPYVYNIVGAGTYSLCDYSLHIEYDLFNVTDDISLIDEYMGDPFVADIVLGGKGTIEPGKSYRVDVNTPVFNR